MKVKLIAGLTLLTISTMFSGFSVYAQNSTAEQQSDLQKERVEFQGTELEDLKKSQDLINDGKFEEAHSIADSLIKKNEQLGEAYFIRGFASLGMENKDEGMADLKKSIRVMRENGKEESAKNIESFIKQMEEDANEAGQNTTNK